MLTLTLVAALVASTLAQATTTGMTTAPVPIPSWQPTVAADNTPFPPHIPPPTYIGEFKLSALFSNLAVRVGLDLLCVCACRCAVGLQVFAKPSS